MKKPVLGATAGVIWKCCNLSSGFPSVKIRGLLVGGAERAVESGVVSQKSFKK
jgi:hypothetical protein